MRFIAAGQMQNDDDDKNTNTNTNTTQNIGMVNIELLYEPQEQHLKTKT